MHHPQSALPVHHNATNSPAAQYLWRWLTGMAAGGAALEQA
jgi:hypothetical protein